MIIWMKYNPGRNTIRDEIISWMDYNPYELSRNGLYLRLFLIK